MQVRDVHILTHADTGNPRGCFVEVGSAEELGVAISRDGSVRCEPAGSCSRKHKCMFFTTVQRRSIRCMVCLSRVIMFANVACCMLLRCM